jgi:hypothetical protein
LRVLDEAGQSICPGGIAGGPRMRARDHHSRHVVTVVAQTVEVSVRHREEMLRAAEAMSFSPSPTANVFSEPSS